MNTAQSPIIFGIHCMVINAEKNGKQIKQFNFSQNAWEDMVSMSTTHDLQDGYNKTCFGYPVNITDDIQDGFIDIDYYPQKTIN